MAKHQVEECRKKFWPRQTLGMVNIGPFCVVASDMDKLSPEMKAWTKRMRDFINEMAVMAGKEPFANDEKRFQVSVWVGDGELMYNSHDTPPQHPEQHNFDTQDEAMAKFDELVKKYKDEDVPIVVDEAVDTRPTMPGAKA